MKIPLLKNKKINTEAIRISFDLDETLFVSPLTHKIEKPLIFPLNKIFIERIRYGAPNLINELKKRGYEVWVYTSSYRSENYIKWLFRFYGISFDGIINAQRHLREVQKGKNEMLPQKLPNRYRISLHIDDEAVVASYGKAYGFEVFRLDAQDDDWQDKILLRIQQIEKKKQKIN